MNTQTEYICTHGATLATTTLTQEFVTDCCQAETTYLPSQNRQVCNCCYAELTGKEMHNEPQHLEGYVMAELDRSQIANLIASLSHALVEADQNHDIQVRIDFWTSNGEGKFNIGINRSMGQSGHVHGYAIEGL